MTDFWDKTENQFFISGMALNGFFHDNKSVIERLLKEGKEVFVLMIDPDAIEENTKLYHGISLDEREFAKNKNKILHKQLSTLNYIEEIKDIFDYIKNEKFKLKVLNSTMSTSFVAYDIFEKEMLSHNREKEGKEIKASFYQYKCTEPKEEPNIIIDSFHSRDWYLIFKNTIQMQWKDAKSISNERDFEVLHERIDSLMSKNKMIYADNTSHQK